MQVNFTRAFETAWERMTVILFQPVDPAKWLLIGFNVFLALLAEGGFAVNNPFSGDKQNYNFTTQSGFKMVPVMQHQLKEWVEWLRQLPTNSWLLLWIVAGVLYLVIWLILNWVGCRAQFVVLDNIVRNRAALAEPWRRYSREGNLWFPVNVGLSAFSSIAFFAMGGGFVALNWSWIDAERYPIGAEMMMVAISVLAWFLLWVTYSAIIYLIRSFVLPIYFKQTMSLGAAMTSVTQLTLRHPGSVFVYLCVSLLFEIVGGLLAALVFCVVCCVICWLAFLPFIGSMTLSLILCELILPLLIFLRCFQLDCLAQFGPEYDVWTVDVPNRPLPPG